LPVFYFALSPLQAGTVFRRRNIQVQSENLEVLSVSDFRCKAVKI